MSVNPCSGDTIWFGTFFLDKHFSSLSIDIPKLKPDPECPLPVSVIGNLTQPQVLIDVLLTFVMGNLISNQAHSFLLQCTSIASEPYPKVTFSLIFLRR